MTPTAPTPESLAAAREFSTQQHSNWYPDEIKRLALFIEEAARKAAESERAAISAALHPLFNEIDRAAYKVQDWEGTRLGDAIDSMRTRLGAIRNEHRAGGGA